MAPELAFQDSVSKHLARVHARELAAQQNQNWTVELLRQASINSIRTTHLRDTSIELQSITREVENVVHEIQILVPVIVWVWDIVKNRPDLMGHLSAIEDSVRESVRHDERHGHFFEMYKKNQQGGLGVFQAAIQDLLSLFKQADTWMSDPIAALRRIHDAQDGVVLTGLFLEMMYETTVSLKILKDSDQQKIATAIKHFEALGQKLHLKESRLREAVSRQV